MRCCSIGPCWNKRAPQHEAAGPDTRFAGTSNAQRAEKLPLGGLFRLLVGNLGLLGVMLGLLKVMLDLSVMMGGLPMMVHRLRTVMGSLRMVVRRQLRTLVLVVVRCLLQVMSGLLVVMHGLLVVMKALLMMMGRLLVMMRSLMVMVDRRLMVISSLRLLLRKGGAADDHRAGCQRGGKSESREGLLDHCEITPVCLCKIPSIERAENKPVHSLQSYGAEQKIEVFAKDVI